MVFEKVTALHAICVTACAIIFASFFPVAAVMSEDSAYEQDPDEAAGQGDPWAAYRPLSGVWEGRMDDRFGLGSANRKYEFIFGDNFLIGWHTSVRQPQELSPAGDFHQELSIFSFDAERETIVLRQFLNEGFVLKFVCAARSMQLICVSEHVENGHEIRAKLTIEFESDYKFSEIFELGSGGEDLLPFTAIDFTRAPSLDD